MQVAPQHETFEETCQQLATIVQVLPLVDIVTGLLPEISSLVFCQDEQLQLTGIIYTAVMLDNIFDRREVSGGYQEYLQELYPEPYDVFQPKCPWIHPLRDAWKRDQRQPDLSVEEFVVGLVDLLLIPCTSAVVKPKNVRYVAGMCLLILVEKNQYATPNPQKTPPCCDPSTDDRGPTPDDSPVIALVVSQQENLVLDKTLPLLLEMCNAPNDPVSRYIGLSVLGRVCRLLPPPIQKGVVFTQMRSSLEECPEVRLAVADCLGHLARCATVIDETQRICDWTVQFSRGSRLEAFLTLTVIPDVLAALPEAERVRLAMDVYYTVDTPLLTIAEPALLYYACGSDLKSGVLARLSMLDVPIAEFVTQAARRLLLTDSGLVDADELFDHRASVPFVFNWGLLYRSEVSLWRRIRAALDEGRRPRFLGSVAHNHNVLRSMRNILRTVPHAWTSVAVQAEEDLRRLPLHEKEPLLRKLNSLGSEVGHFLEDYRSPGISETAERLQRSCGSGFLLSVVESRLTDLLGAAASDEATDDEDDFRQLMRSRSVLLLDLQETAEFCKFSTWGRILRGVDRRMVKGEALKRALYDSELATDEQATPVDQAYFEIVRSTGFRVRHRFWLSLLKLYLVELDDPDSAWTSAESEMEISDLSMESPRDRFTFALPAMQNPAKNGSRVGFLETFAQFLEILPTDLLADTALATPRFVSDLMSKYQLPFDWKEKRPDVTNSEDWRAHVALSSILGRIASALPHFPCDKLTVKRCFACLLNLVASPCYAVRRHAAYAALPAACLPQIPTLLTLCEDLSTNRNEGMFDRTVGLLTQFNSSLLRREFRLLSHVLMATSRSDDHPRQLNFFNLLRGFEARGTPDTFVELLAGSEMVHLARNESVGMRHEVYKFLQTHNQKYRGLRNPLLRGLHERLRRQFTIEPDRYQLDFEDPHSRKETPSNLFNLAYRLLPIRKNPALPRRPGVGLLKKLVASTCPLPPTITSDTLFLLSWTGEPQGLTSVESDDDQVADLQGLALEECGECLFQFHSSAFPVVTWDSWWAYVYEEPDFC